MHRARCRERTSYSTYDAKATMAPTSSLDCSSGLPDMTGRASPWKLWTAVMSAAWRMTSFVSFVAGAVELVPGNSLQCCMACMPCE